MCSAVRTSRGSLVARIPNAELDLMPDAGHSPWLDDLDRCAAAVSDFLLRDVSMAQREERLA